MTPSSSLAVWAARAGVWLRGQSVTPSGNDVPTMMGRVERSLLDAIDATCDQSPIYLIDRGAGHPWPDGLPRRLARCVRSPLASARSLAGRTLGVVQRIRRGLRDFKPLTAPPRRTNQAVVDAGGTGLGKAGIAKPFTARRRAVTIEPGAQPPVAVVILTWNALTFTKACLASIQGLTQHHAWRVIVVDNGSTDGTPDWLERDATVTTIRNSRNLGFAKAANIGISATRPEEDVVLMNNDVVITDPGWLEKMQRVAYASPDAGVVGARLVDGRGKVLHLGAFMLPRTVMGQQLGGLELDVNQANSDRLVESVVFAQAYLRRDCLEAVGPLDEDLFAYFEDSDFCLRAQLLGFEPVCAGGVTTVHHQSTTVRENNVDFGSIYLRSRKVFAPKWSDWLESQRYDLSLTWHSVVDRPPGYAVQSRRLMAALHFAGVKLAFRNAYGHVNRPVRDALIDDLLARRPRADVAQVAFCQADAFAAVKGPLRVGWTMLEVTGVPEAWVAGCNLMDEVWVPAAFNVETFRHSGVSVPIRVMPLGVDTDYFHPAISGFRPSRRFTFLSVFEWGERKAPEVLLDAYSKEFSDADDVLLVLSVVNHDPYVDVREQIAAMRLPRSAPIVVLVNPRFPEHQMGALYRSADCFVLPTRGEGWGMPILEAMACGLPVIATAWSGPSDFLHEDVGYPLRASRLIPAKARCRYYEGFEWADPDVDELRSLMRSVVEDPESARAKGKRAAAEVAAQWTLQTTAERVKQRLLELS